MPDALEQFARETIEEIRKEWPVEERLKGLSVDQLVAAMSPEMRAALAQRLKDYGQPPASEKGGPDHAGHQP
jgi:hypothetical protein